MTTFRLKFAHFCLICQKIDTLSFLMSYYSSLSNKRAGWNKRAGRKFCQILGDFESLDSQRVDLSHFQ